MGIYGTKGLSVTYLLLDRGTGKPLISVLRSLLFRSLLSDNQNAALIIDHWLDFTNSLYSCTSTKLLVMLLNKLKFILGSVAWGNKTKEMYYSYDFFCFFSPKPRSQV